MTRYLLDTNHLSAPLNNDAGIQQGLRDARLRGDRVATCVPVLCELQAGIAFTAQRAQNQHRLSQLLRQVRLWPLDADTAFFYGELFYELRRKGRALSQVDIMLAALARQVKATVVSTDRDFDAVPGIQTESWLAH